MTSIRFSKNTFLFFLLFFFCFTNIQKIKSKSKSDPTKEINSFQIAFFNSKKQVIPGAENYEVYLPLIKNKKVGVVTNQTGIIFSKEPLNTSSEKKIAKNEKLFSISLIDYLITYKKVNVTKIYALEHGFRGNFNAGELIKDGKDTKTNLPIISLYGNNKKPSEEQLKEIDIMIFDLQDVGVRFYTYISSLHYIMEACAENHIPLIILDRPNPNGNIIDGPVLEMAYKSFVGMHPVPILHGMTIGEYAQMINGEKWLNNGIQCSLTVVPCLNYTKEIIYSIPINPSPNLPNDQSVNLYASLCLFEGTNVSVGRGTDKPFQIYGSPYLPKNSFLFTPKPSSGAKKPLYKDIICYGEDLSSIGKVNKLELKWLIKAYQNTSNQSSFFNSFFTKLAGTQKLQQQIEQGMEESQIRKSWEEPLYLFKEMRKNYLIYPE